MPRSLSILLLAAITVAVQTPSVRAEHLSIIGGEIPFVFHSRKPGPHNVFYDTVLKDVAGAHDIKYLPYKRALRDFNAGSADCLYVATANTIDYPNQAIAKGNIIFSEPINWIHLRAYTRHGTPPISALKDFEGKVAAGSKSLLATLQKVLAPKTQVALIPTIDHLKAFDLLAEDRVEVVIAFGLDANEAELQTGRGPFTFDEKLILDTRHEVVACWKTIDTLSFLAKLDSTIIDLEKQNRLAKIFSGKGLRPAKN